MRLLAPVVQALAFVVFASGAHAATSFRIESLFSSQDGQHQYVVLRESAGRDGEHAIGGLVLRATGGGTTRDFVIPRGLFRPNTAHTAVVITSSFYAPACCVLSTSMLEDGSTVSHWEPTYVSPDIDTLPANFLSVDGGTVEIVGVDSVTHGPLPRSGTEALDRHGQVVAARFVPFWLATFAYPILVTVPLPVQVLATGVQVREYYHAGLDRYAMLGQGSDIQAVESGAAGGWSPTGWGFGALSLSGTVDLGLPGVPPLEYDTVPVCRYYLPPPRSTHFYSAFPDECASVGAIPGAILESAAAFYVHAADRTTGSCGNRYAIYRLWNGRAEANHRWTMSEESRTALIAQGWKPEGAGPLGVAFCGGLRIIDDWF